MVPAAAGGGDARGVRGLKNTHFAFATTLVDDGRNGDEVAGDGVWTNDGICPEPGDFQIPAGHYLMRVVAHDEQNAVIVDVDGVDLK